MAGCHSVLIYGHLPRNPPSDRPSALSPIVCRCKRVGTKLGLQAQATDSLLARLQESRRCSQPCLCLFVSLMRLQVFAKVDYNKNGLIEPLEVEVAILSMWVWRASRMHACMRVGKCRATAGCCAPHAATWDSRAPHSQRSSGRLCCN